MASPKSYPAPPYCPNNDCPFHQQTETNALDWFIHHGSYHTKVRGFIHRYRCKHCGKLFSSQTFSIHYWTHRDENFPMFNEH